MGSSNLNFKNFGTGMPPEAAAAGGGWPPGNFPLARQSSSIYSLTFDEFQNTVGGIGKDFGSMNMDELLKNIWNAEENQNIGSTSGGNHGGGQEGSGCLQRQGSLTLPRTLSQRTVDEVWRDMVKEYGGEKDPTCGAMGGFGVPPHRQQTLGEVTLEEFLVRAGVVKEETQLAQKPKNIDLFVNSLGSGFGYNSNQIATQSGNLPLNVNGPQSAAQQKTGASGHPQRQQQQQLLPKQSALAYPSSNNQLTNLGIRGGIIGISEPAMNDAMGSPVVSSDGLTKSNGDTSFVSPVAYVFNGGGLKGRKSAALEKVVERRQRRMIKNRESAARSRACKQAYTMELEAEVAKLKEENELLQKKQAEMLKMQKYQVLEMKQANGNKRRCLRRTQTGPW